MKKSNDLLKIIELVKKQQAMNQFQLEELKPFLNEYIRVRVVPKGGYIAREDVLINRVYYIIQGTYYESRSSEHGKTNLLSRKRAPQFLGVDRAVNSKTACLSSNLALETCVVIEIETEYFLNSIRENGELGLEVIRNLTEKLSNASYRSDQILFLTTKEKLMMYLINYWEEYHIGERACKVDVKNVFIADNIGVSTRTLYRAISEMKEEELISVSKGNIVVSFQQILKMKTSVNLFERC